MKINLAVSQDSNIVGFLKENFNIITKPYVYYKNKRIKTNFDVYYINDIAGSLEETLQYCDLPTIGFARLPKEYQSIVFDNLGISHPDSFKFFTNQSIDSIYMLLSNYDDNDEFIIKMPLGARGLGQVRLQKKDFYTIQSSNDEKLETNKHLIGGNDDDEIKLSTSQNLLDNSNDWFITKKISIKKEYRVLYFYNEKPLICERVVKPSEWQNNISNNNSFIYHGESFLYSDISDIQKNMIIDKVYSLGDNLNTPVLSTDVYIDKNDNVGLFEFQIEFGYQGINKSDLFIKLNKSFKNIIKDKFGI